MAPGRSVAVRFAPSPTGRLHVGNARQAVVNWLFARKHGGSFLLRHDDTDTERSEDRHIDAIEGDLRWLGLTWDSRVRQSERLDRYAAALTRLKAQGSVYPAYETPEELSLKRKAQLNAGGPPLYDRAALRLTPAARAELEAKGRKPHWRFRLEPGQVRWDDVVHGAMAVEAETLSDPVLVREDGTPLYVFTSVVDDAELGISHVIRGDEHLMNSVPQIRLLQALGAAPPVFAHIALLVGAQGEKLSKRLGALSLETLRAEGVEPLAIASFLARLGTSDPVEPRTSTDSIIAGFDLSRFGRAPAHFDADELLALNAKVLHHLPYAAVRERLRQVGVLEHAEAFWHAVRGNLGIFDDVVAWIAVASGPLHGSPPDAEFASRAAELLPSEPWGETTWAEWTTKVSGVTGAKGRALFQPLRLALTGRDTGPEMKALLPLIGRERARSRLRGEAA